MIFDTHAHYDDDAFETDRAEVLSGQWSKGVGRIIDCGADIKSSRRALQLASEYDSIYAAVGIHPDNIAELWQRCPLNDKDPDDEDGVKALKSMAKNEKCVAIGEIGLDYHWDRYPRDRQKEGFIAQWRLAKELGLPVVIHSRDAAEDTFSVVSMMYDEYMREKKLFMADMHCYSYSAEQAAEYLKMGLYFGIGGVLTFKNARKLTEVVKMLPVDRILLETDCPYLAPEPFRGSRNESSYLKGVVQKLAELKEIDYTEVEHITYNNALAFFGMGNHNTDDYA
ncbi:MAG: TatD family hydrolase [Lachnospiraceae bacterium]|nr:TatD family hydrolase [Lachnospiraceae bacterium]